MLILVLLFLISTEHDVNEEIKETCILTHTANIFDRSPLTKNEPWFYYEFVTDWMVKNYHYSTGA